MHADFIWRAESEEEGGTFCYNLFIFVTAVSKRFEPFHIFGAKI